ncbi:DNA primase regulatory subunit PriL [Methanolobus sediminis]|uniref:DNA primase large subunit PriL n=1 Tax=Methanolobus sediminis TaxID=3072978 RepID=A0AA51YKU1_9EURY|nr:DNA primase regulatory subunit PriL [Methanolobus sediminis]WMW24284.1 DNA primase regulatory subunit PriL [Methanolobus sediminis]
MDEKDFALYPYISGASAHVKNLGISLDRLVTSRAMESARIRGKERVMQAIEGELFKPSLSVSDEQKILLELLSYPFSRILVSCIDDPFLIRRYCLAEAVASYKLLKTMNLDFLEEFASDFSVYPDTSDSGFKLHFTSYIRMASSLKAIEWKLVNRKLHHGNVNVSKEEFSRLLQELIKERVEHNLPMPVNEELVQSCEPYLADIRELLEERKSTFGDSEFESVETDLFPPCITQAIANTQAGVNLAHSMRFAMTAFLLTIGMTVDDIMNLFTASPDFDIEKARYQIEHIAGSSGTHYKPPSCSTMQTYGNCYAPDEMCKKISHPLNYYSRKVWFRKRDTQKAAGNNAPEKSPDE